MSYLPPPHFGFAPAPFGPPPFGHAPQQFGHPFGHAPQQFGHPFGHAPQQFGHPFGHAPQQFGQPRQPRTVGNEQDRDAHFADLHERYRLEKEYIGQRIRDHDNATERISDKEYLEAVDRWDKLHHDLMPAAQRREYRPDGPSVGGGPERMIEYFSPLKVAQPHPAYGMPPISTAGIDPREFEQPSVLVFNQDGHVHRVPTKMHDGTPVMRKIMPKTLSMTRYFPVPVENSNAVRLVP